MSRSVPTFLSFGRLRDVNAYMFSWACDICGLSSDELGSLPTADVEDVGRALACDFIRLGQYIILRPDGDEPVIFDCLIGEIVDCDEVNDLLDQIPRSNPLRER